MNWEISSEAIESMAATTNGFNETIFRKAIESIGMTEDEFYLYVRIHLETVVMMRDYSKEVVGKPDMDVVLNVFRVHYEMDH